MVDTMKDLSGAETPYARGRGTNSSEYVSDTAHFLV